MTTSSGHIPKQREIRPVQRSLTESAIFCNERKGAAAPV
jgi:hypothetical protein